MSFFKYICMYNIVLNSACCYMFVKDYIFFKPLLNYTCCKYLLLLLLQNVTNGPMYNNRIIIYIIQNRQVNESRFFLV